MSIKRLTHHVRDVAGMRFGFTHDQVWLEDKADPDFIKISEGGTVTSEALYLERWVLWFGYTLRLHRFTRPDDTTRGIHTHPWWFLTWVLPFPGKGMYFETRCYHNPKNTRRWHTIKGVHFSPKDRSHAIMRIVPGTWTLVLTGRAFNRDWGFIDKDGNFTIHDRPKEKENES